MSSLVVLPNQLFRKVFDLDFNEIIVVEHPRYFTDFNFNKKKLILHRASMQYFVDELKKDFNTQYVKFDEDYKSILGDEDLVFFEPVDSKLKIELDNLNQNYDFGMDFLDSPLFISDMDWNKSVLNETGFFHLEYYKRQRRKLNVLMKDDKPLGGKWSFDPDNREKMPEDLEPPELPSFDSNYLEEAKKYVINNFDDNPGTVEDFVFPLTHDEAKKLLEDFLENRLDRFGPYQDAIDKDLRFGFHSLLSSSLNIGLVTPSEVVDRTLDYFRSDSTDVELRSVEGFLRQIIGWREYVRAIYELRGDELKNSNFWGHGNDLPEGFYSGDTGIKPLDVSINNALNNGYCHHIERLMVLGNFLLLCEVDPDTVYQWFMEMFIDAYDWVMVPNIYGMSQYSWTEMMTKPYISSSNYINKMSHYGEGDWCDIWDGLYWRFIKENVDKIEDIPRMKIMTYQLDNMSDKTLENHLDNAEKFLDDIVR